MKYQQKLQALSMRKEGKSYTEIRKTVPISKSTLSLWLRDIKLTPEQSKRLYVTLRQQNGYRQAKLMQQKREDRRNNTITQAEKEFTQLKANSFFLSGLMLYWAEGDKTEKGLVKFSNSNPSMILFMVKWFTDICAVPKEKIKIELHIHELLHQKDTETYWSNLTAIPLNQFQKTQIKPTSLGHRKKLLYNGTCALRISNTILFWKIQGWTKGFIENMDKITKIR